MLVLNPDSLLASHVTCFCHFGCILMIQCSWLLYRCRYNKCDNNFKTMVPCYNNSHGYARCIQFVNKVLSVVFRRPSISQR